MASNDHEHEFSAFKGRPLVRAKNIAGNIARKLSDLGIHDAEQLVAVASIDDIRRKLADQIGLSESDVGKVISNAQKTLPDYVSMELQRPQPADLGLGALEPTPEMMAEAAALMAPAPFAAELAAALPNSVSHIKMMPAIRAQGQRGTCVAFAMTAVHEFYRITSGNAQDLSEQFLYEETKRIDGSPNACGTWQVKAAQVLGRLGECREAIWSYNPNLPCNSNGVEPPSARADAALFKIQPIVLNPKDVNAIKGALAGGSAVGFSIPVYNSWYQSAETRRSGRITMRIGGEPSDSGHAMCLVGYQDDEASPGGGYFILRNSWNTSWGSECPYGAGYGTIPYQYLINDNWEAVTLPPGHRRIPTPRPPTPRPWPWWPFGEVDGQTSARPTLTIETGGAYDIIVR